MMVSLALSDRQQYLTWTNFASVREKLLVGEQLFDDRPLVNVKDVLGKRLQAADRRLCQWPVSATKRSVTRAHLTS